MTLGEIAYEAYRTKSGGISLVSKKEIPPFAQLPAEIQMAWQAAATKVSRQVFSDFFIWFDSQSADDITNRTVEENMEEFFKKESE